MIDANEYYLSKYEDNIEKSERLQAGFENDISYDLCELLTYCENIKSLAIRYEHEYFMEFDYKEIIIGYIKDNLWEEEEKICNSYK